MKAKYAVPILVAALLVFLVGIGVTKSILMNERAEDAKKNFITSLNSGDFDSMVNYLNSEDKEAAVKYFKSLTEEQRKDLADIMFESELIEESIGSRVYRCKSDVGGPLITYGMKYVDGKWLIMTNDG